MNIFQLLFGTKHARDVKKLRPIVAKINEWDEKFKSLSDDELKAKTPEFRERFTKGESLDELLPEAFAVVKNACRRLLGTTCEAKPSSRRRRCTSTRSPARTCSW